MLKSEIVTAVSKSSPQCKVCDYTYVQNGVDTLGLPTFKIDFTAPPLNYKLIRVLETPKVAILEDLDYVAPAGV